MTPRRCSRRWLDADCPREVLAIMDYPSEPSERYTVFYVAVSEVTYPYSRRVEQWHTYFSLDVHGNGSHGEMQAHKLAQYRYRMKHRYTRWSALPEAVKAAVRRDIQEVV